MSDLVLVTGATGFVGGWAVAMLLRQGYGVRATIRSRSKEGAVREAVGKVIEPDDRLEFAVADLMGDEGWDAAMLGVDYVLHVASPLSGEGAVKDRHALVAPARDGTLRVLKAAVGAGVKRVVMTSAAATTRQRLDLDVPSDETLWADPDDPQFDAYRVSKILAEKAAWDFMAKHGGKTEFTTILPGAVFGPILTNDNLGSVQIIKGLLEGRPYLAPQLGFWVVDVRDLVDLHIKAMEAPAAAGQRFLAVSEFKWMPEIGRILKRGMGARGSNASTRQLPNFLVKLMAPFMPQLAPLAPLIGRRYVVSNEKVRRILGFHPRPATETILDCARSLPT